MGGGSYFSSELFGVGLGGGCDGNGGDGEYTSYPTSAVLCCAVRRGLVAGGQSALCCQSVGRRGSD